jgi:hypothetical protein
MSLSSRSRTEGLGTPVALSILSERLLPKQHRPHGLVSSVHLGETISFSPNM